MSLSRALQSLLRVVFTHHTFLLREEFEKKFALSVGQEYAAVTSHARFALYLTLKSLNLSPGDEVLISPINIPDMINMITLSGLKARVVDYEKNSFNISLNDLKSKKSPNTKIFFYALLAGILPDNIEEIIEFAKENNIILVFDLTQVYGLLLKGKNISCYADVSIFALCDLKDIHTHRGGMIVTNNKGMIQEIKRNREKEERNPSKKYFLSFVVEDFVSCIILNRTFFSIFIYPILYVLYHFGKMQDVVNLTKGNGIVLFGVNVGRGIWGGGGDLSRTEIPDELRYRFTDMQAQIGLDQLGLAHARIEKRIENAMVFSKNIPKDLLVSFPKSTYWKFPVVVNDITWWQKNLFEYGIDSAPSNLPCLCELKFFKKHEMGEAPNASIISKTILYVPLHHYLTEMEVLKVAQIVTSIYQKKVKIDRGDSK